MRGSTNRNAGKNENFSYIRIKQRNRGRKRGGSNEAGREKRGSEKYLGARKVQMHSQINELAWLGAAARQAWLHNP